MVTKVRAHGDVVIITEDGTDYVCDHNPGVISGDLLIAEFHPIGYYRKALLVECIQDEEALAQTYRPFKTEQDEEKAREIYAYIMDCM